MRQLHLSHRLIPSVANHVLSEVGREYSTYQPLTPRIRYSRHHAARSRQKASCRDQVEPENHKLELDRIGRTKNPKE